MAVPLLIAALVFITCVTAVFGFLSYADTRRGSKAWRERVEGLSTAAQEEEGGGDELSGLEYFQQRLLNLLERMGKISQPKKASEVSALKRSLLTAGFRKPSASTVFFGVKVLLAVGFPLIAIVVPIPALLELPNTQRMVVYVGLAAVGLYGPELWLRRAMNRRRQKITEGFPDALDLMVVCVEAGLGMDAAVNRTGSELKLVHVELADEFHVLTLELRAGLPRDQALTHLAERIDLDMVKSLVALLIQTDRFGTSVGQALRVYSDSMRTERALKAEERAAKLPVQMLFPLMFFIFPSLFIVILGPAIIQGMRLLIPALQS